MDITATTASTTRGTGTGTGTGNAVADTAATTDYNTFLRMLTTQMQNQDPLNPIESSDYAVQLATFSGVEQQTLTNQLMQKLLGAIGGNSLSEHAHWVGKEARSSAPVAHDGTPVTLHAAPDSTADRAVLAVRNERGVVVARQDVVLGSTVQVWNGTGVTGAAMPPGTYSFKLESYVGDTLLSERPAEAYARITEVRAAPGGTQVVLAGGIGIAADQVKALRDGT